MAGGEGRRRHRRWARHHPADTLLSFRRLTRSDYVVAGAAILLLVLWCLPWYRGEGELAGVQRRGWDYFLGGTVPALIAAAMLSAVVVRAWLPRVRLPDLPVSLPRALQLAGLATAVLLLGQRAVGERTCVEGSCGDLEGRPALVVAVFAGLALALGGWLAWLEARSTDSGQ